MAAQERHIRFHALLPADLFVSLKEQADKEDRSMAAVVRLAIEDRIKQAEVAA